MHLTHLNIVNFKNIQQAEINPIAGINCFVGKNGVGKTNILDAIHYLAFCKSFINTSDSQNINHNEDFFVLQSTININESDNKIYCGIKRGQKKQFKLNKKEYPKLSEHIGLVPLVLISPHDEYLISDGGEARRKYLDSVISQYNKEYLQELINYNRIINQRNAYLKGIKSPTTESTEILDVWDLQLSRLATIISNLRQSFLDELTPIFQKYYKYISDSSEKIGFKYKSHINDGDLFEQLVASRQKDIILGYTSKGIHRDDVVFTLNNHSLKKQGSQGQSKTFLIALKLGQFNFLAKYKGYKPILLLDDIFDKLDIDRGKRLIELVCGDDFNQIFITDTQIQRIEPILKSIKNKGHIYNVDNGVVSVYN